MTVRFDIGDSVTWRELGSQEELWESWEHEIPELAELYGTGPFAVASYEWARETALIKPPHPQLLLLTRNTVLIPRLFSGILLRKAS